MSAEAAQRAFEFSRERAALSREAQASAKRSSSAMPSSINGKVVTRFLRSGKALCPDFQVDACHVGEAVCGEAHLCAILLRTGRACGGKHPAQASLAKRHLLAADVESAPLAQVAVPSTSAQAELPVAAGTEAGPETRASPPDSSSTTVRESQVTVTETKTVTSPRPSR